MARTHICGDPNDPCDYDCMCMYYRNRVTCWCVRHNDGWCACKTDKEPDEGATNVETKCDMVVTLPLETAERIPTCSECLAVRKKEREE